MFILSRAPEDSDHCGHFINDEWHPQVVGLASWKFFVLKLKRVHRTPLIFERSCQTLQTDLLMGFSVFFLFSLSCCSCLNILTFEGYEGLVTNMWRKSVRVSLLGSVHVVLGLGRLARIFFSLFWLLRGVPIHTEAFFDWVREGCVFTGKTFTYSKEYEHFGLFEEIMQKEFSEKASLG